MTHPNLSLESMVESLFGATTGSAVYGFESEDLTPEETAVIEGDEAPEAVEVPEEAATAPEGTPEAVTADALEAADAEDEEVLETATECQRLLGDAAGMAIALRTAESYIWSLEDEAAAAKKDDNKIVANLKKFWAWIKGILEKIKLAVVNFYRRVTIWLAGDMKKYAAFYKGLSAEQKSKIEGSDVKMKVKLPTDMGKVTAEFVKDLTNADTRMASVIAGITAGKVDQASLDDLNGELGNKVTVKAQSEALYGKDAKAVEATAKTFFAAYPLANLETAAAIKVNYSEGQKIIKTLQKSIAAAVKAGAKVEGAESKAVKAAGSALQRCEHNVSTGLVWFTSQAISLTATAMRFAQKALKGGEAKK